jgi:hypothetical protein
MTTEVGVHPRILKATAALQKRIEALDPELAEVVLMARIVVRHGIPIKVKWSHESEECYS